MRNVRFLSFAIVLCLLLSMVPCGVYAAEQSGICGANLVWNYDASSKRLTVSGKMKNCNFIIGSSWSDIKDVKTVEIKDGVTEIGGSAFQNMSSIESVLIADTVTKTGDSAFSGCTALENITIENGVEEIQDSAFPGCTALEELVIPDSVVKIGKIIMYAYIGSYMSSLKSITVGSGNSAYASDNGVLYDKAQSQLFFTRPQSLTRNTHFLPRSAHRIQRAAPQKAMAAAMSALLHIMCRAERKSLPQVLTETVFLRTQKRHCPEHQCRN